MLAVIQRVSSSKVSVDGKTVGEIGQGLNILLGVKKGDTTVDIKKLADKILNLRIFKDENDVVITTAEEYFSGAIESKKAKRRTILIDDYTRKNFKSFDIEIKK